VALSKLVLNIGMVTVPVRIENAIGKATKPVGSYVCAGSGLPKKTLGEVLAEQPAPKTKRVSNKATTSVEVGNACGHEHDGECRQVVGYPRPDGSYFVPSEDDLIEIEADKDSLIHLDSFVPSEEVDPAYFETTYVVRPEKGYEAAFWLIAARLEKLQRTAVGSAVLSKDDKLVFLRWSKQFQCLFLCVGVYDEQIKYDLIKGAQASRVTSFKREEIALADQMMTKVYTRPFVAAEYPPKRWHALSSLIEKNGASATGAPVKPSEDGPVLDLMAQLTATLATSNGKTAANGKTTAKKKPRAKKPVTA
jgi:DNA end-binding protein Ku